MTAADARWDVPLMATVNGVIDDLHGSLGLVDSDFFCECDHVGCKERITLTRAGYARLRAAARPVLVPAHAYRDYLRAGTAAAVERTGEKESVEHGR